MKIAIVTGASSGIGTEFYKLMQDEPLDEVWVVARREKNLIDLCKSHGKIGHRVIPMDLTDEAALSNFASLLENERPTIKFLFNNAGFGLFGKADEIDYKKQGKMIDTNVRALTEFTSIALKYMDEKSYIINTCSTAAFTPVPNLSAYAATKSYVLSFSRALREELKERKINVTAICPGPMATEFLSVAGLGNGESKRFSSLPYCDPYKTAKNGIRAAKKGKALYTPRFLYNFHRFLAKFTPHSMLMKLTKV